MENPLFLLSSSLSIHSTSLTIGKGWRKRWKMKEGEVAGKKERDDDEGAME